SAGGIRATERLRGGSRARRSEADNSGIRAYIITRPEANHAMNSRQPPIPSQRCVNTTTRRQSSLFFNLPFAFCDLQSDAGHLLALPMASMYWRWQFEHAS